MKKALKFTTEQAEYLSAAPIADSLPFLFSFVQSRFGFVAKECKIVQVPNATRLSPYTPKKIKHL